MYQKGPMRKPGARFRTLVVILLLLTAGAVSASAQSSRGTLAISLQVVPSTALLFGEDGTARIVEANGANGLTITTIGEPAKVGRDFNVSATRTNALTTTTALTQKATQIRVAGRETK
jgi:hypothetical protein